MKKFIIAFLAIALVSCSLLFRPSKKELHERVFEQLDSLHLENERKKVEMQKLESVKELQKPPSIRRIAKRKPVKFKRTEQKRNNIETVELETVTVKPKTRILRIKDGEKVIEEKIIK